MTAPFETAEKHAAETPSATESLSALQRYISGQNAQNDASVTSMSQRMNKFIAEQVPDESAKQVLTAYVAAWDPLARAIIAAQDYRASVQNAKAQIEANQLDLQATDERLTELKKKRADLAVSIAGKNVSHSLGILAATLSWAFAYVWLFGVLIEYAGLFIDMAQNMRRVRSLVEAVPHVMA